MPVAPQNDKGPGRQFVDYDEYVDLQLHKARTKIKAADIFGTLTLLSAAAIAYLLVFAVCDQWLIEGGFGAGTRLALLVVALAVGGTLFVRRVLVPLVRRIHPLYAARMIEQAAPDLKSNLLNFVDLSQAPEAGQTAPAVLRAMEKRAALQLSHIDVDEAVDRRHLLRTAYALLAVVVLSAVYIVLSPKDPFVSVKRALLPTADVEVATETTIEAVTPGDDSVPARTLLKIEAEIRGQDADTARILFTTVDHKYVDEPVEMRRVDPDLPRFRGMLNGENGKGLLQSLTYSIAAGDARTREFRVDVVRPPSAKVDSVDYACPHYMQIENRSSPDGNIEGWEGTMVTLHATANMPVASALIAFSDTEESTAKAEEVGMQIVDGTKLTATWKLDFRSDGTCPRFYRIRVRTEAGQIDPDPTLHTIRIRPDQKPEVALLAPTADLQKPANAIVPLLIQALDPDFQLRSITLRAERNGEELVNTPLFEDRELGQRFQGSYDFELQPLRLKPRETIQFWIEARDNKQPNANRAATARLNIEILPEKSADEIKRELAADKQAQQDQLASAEKATNSEGQKPQPGGRRGDEPERSNADNEKQPRNEKQPKPENGQSASEKSRGGDSNSENKADRAQNPRERRTPSDQNQNALEKLLQKQEREEQPENNDRPEPSEQPKDAERSPNGQASQEKKESGGQKSRGGSGENSKQPAGDKAENQPGEKSGNAGSEKEQPKPSEKSGSSEKTGDRSPSGSEGSPDAQDSAKDQNKAAGKPEGDSEKPGSDKNAPGGDKGNGTAENSDKDKPKTGEERSTSADGKTTDQGSRSGDKETGEASGGSKSSGGDAAQQAKKSQQPGASEKEEPAEKSPDAQKRQATGNEKGEAEGADKRDPDAVRSKDNDLNRKAGSKPGATQESTDQGQKKGSGERPPDGDTKSSNSDAEAARRAPQGKDDTEQPPRVDDPSSKTSEDKNSRKPEQRPGQPPEGGNEEPKGPGRKDGQQAEQAEKGEKGNSTASDQGTKGANKSGAGDKDTQPGRDNQANQKTGESGQKKGPGSKTAPSSSGNKPAGENSGNPGNKPVKADKPENPGNKPGTKSNDPAGVGNKPESNQPGEPDQPGSGGQKPGPGRDSDESGSKSGNKPGNSSGQPKPGSNSSEDKSGSKPGEDKAGSKPGEGKAGSKPGEEKAGSKPGSKPGGGKPGSKPGEGKGGSQPGEGQAGNEPGKGHDDSPRSSGSGVTGPADSSGQPTGNDASGDAPSNRPQGGDADSEPSPEEEQARLDYARQASNLVLQKLKRQLERGQVDEELMKELGWHDIGDARKFAKFLEENLNSRPDDNSPEALARRLQFEEMLRSLRVGPETSRREGGKSPERRTEQIGARDVPLPPQYREAYENYSRQMSKQATPRATDKAKAKGAAK